MTFFIKSFNKLYHNFKVIFSCDFLSFASYTIILKSFLVLTFLLKTFFAATLSYAKDLMAKSGGWRSYDKELKRDRIFRKENSDFFSDFFSTFGLLRQNDTQKYQDFHYQNGAVMIFKKRDGYITFNFSSEQIICLFL